MNEYESRLRALFLDEVRGDAFFGALVAAQHDDERREKLRTLQTIEARTVTTLRRLLEDAELRVDDRAARAEGRELAPPVGDEDWDDIVGRVAATVPHAQDAVEQLRELSSRPSDPAFRALLNHVHAIERFVELERSGRGKESLKVLTDHLRRPA